jgi:hypothetical protein
MTEKTFIIAFVILAIIIPIFIGIIIGKAWSLEAQDYLDKIINDTKDLSNFSQIDPNTNYTDERGNTFSGNNLNLDNNQIKPNTPWPICGLFNVPAEDGSREYWCHST